jgi:AcrR family transcriptional regulator
VRTRRARREPSEVRSLLIATASDVYRTRPYEEVTNQEIATLAGVSSSVLYRNFPTKASLFQAAFLAPFTEFLTAFRETYAVARGEQQGELELVTSFMRDLYAHLHAHREVLTGLLSAEASLDADSRRQVRGVFDDLFTELQAIGSDQSRSRGWFPDSDMELTTRLLVGMVSAMVTFEPWFLPSGASGDLDHVAEHMARLILYGMRLSPVGADALYVL